MQFPRLISISASPFGKPVDKFAIVLEATALGTFIPGRLGTSLAACRDNNKHGGHVTRMVNANSSREIDQVLSFAP